MVAFSTRPELLGDTPRLWPRALTLENFERVPARCHIATWFGNSVAISAILPPQRVHSGCCCQSRWQGQVGSDFGATMAFALINVVPTIVLFSVFQRYFVQGFTRSGNK